MNKDIIHKAIENPDLTLSTGVEDLEKISSQYPFFGAAQLLLTKAYQRTNDYRYTDQLHQAAIYSTDRKHLYDWIKAKHETPVLEMKQEVISKPTIDKVEVEKISEVKTVNVEEKPQTIQSVSEVIVPSNENVADLVSLMLEDELPATKAKEEKSIPEKAEEKTSIEKIEVKTETIEVEKQVIEIPTVAVDKRTKEESTIREEEIEEITPSTKGRDFDFVEKEILLEAMQSSIELEVSEGIEDIEAEPVVVKKQEVDEEETPDAGSYAAWIYSRSRQVHFSDEASEKPAESEPQAVSDWQRNAPIHEEELEEEDSDIEAPKEESRNLSHGIKKLTPSPQKTTQQDLIDRFIKSEQKITPGKALEYTAGNFAKESLEEDFSFVTETMAILFAQQGKPDKARKAFKKLMELHPEKSVYFAAQLKSLDKYKK